MKKLLLVSLAGVAAAVTPAQAHPRYHYVGGCGFSTIGDGTDSPQTQWDGEIHVVAFAEDAHAGTPAPVRIDIDCELRINGATPGTIVFSCSTPGTGFVSCAGQFSFNADPDDIVTMCDNVTVGGEFHKVCGDATTTSLVDEPPPDPWDAVARFIDQATCPSLASMSGGPTDQPPAFDIRPDGDIYVDGVWFWDCPPYGTSGN